MNGSGAHVSSWSFLLRGIVAAFRRKIHLSTCPNFPGRLSYYPTAEALRFLAEQGVDVNWVLTGNMALSAQVTTQDGATSTIVVSAKGRTRADPGELLIDILTPLLRQTVEDAKRVEDIDWLATATKFSMQYALKYAERRHR